MTLIFRHCAFRHLWLASLLSVLGSQVSRIGLLLYVFQISDGAVALVVFVILETLPGALAAPVAGAFVDNYSKKTVMIASDLTRLVLMLIILWQPTLSVIYFVTAIHSVATAFFYPAKSAAITSIVNQSELAEANGAEQSATNLMWIAGPVIGAQLITQLGLWAVLLLDACSFLLSALFIARIELRTPHGIAQGLSPRQALREIKEGWRYLTQHQLALHLNMLLFVALICTGTWVPLAPFFIREQLSGSEQILGWQLGIFGIGAVIGGIYAPHLIRRFRAGAILFAGFMAEAGALGLYGMVRQMGLSMLLVLLWGVSVSVIVVTFYTIMQTVVEERFLGRMFSVVKQTESLATVFAMCVVMLLQGAFESYQIFIAAGLVYLGCTAASTLSRGGKSLLAMRRGDFEGNVG